MGYEDDARTRTAARLAALALARACAEGVYTGDIPLDSAITAGLFLAGMPGGDTTTMPDPPEPVVWLLGACAQVCAVALHRWAAAQSGHEPTLAEVTAVCDELEAGLITADTL